MTLTRNVTRRSSHNSPTAQAPRANARRKSVGLRASALREQLQETMHNAKGWNTARDRLLDHRAVVRTRVGSRPPDSQHVPQRDAKLHCRSHNELALRSRAQSPARAESLAE